MMVLTFFHPTAPRVRNFLFILESLLTTNEKDFNPLSPSIKLHILLCVSIHFIQKQWGEAVKISIDFNLSDHVINSHDLTN